MNTAWNDYRGKILVEGAGIYEVVLVHNYTQCQEDMGEWRYIVCFFYMLTLYIIEIEIFLVSIQQQNLSLENYVELRNITVQISTNMSQSS